MCNKKYNKDKDEDEQEKEVKSGKGGKKNKQLVSGFFCSLIVIIPT